MFRLFKSKKTAPVKTEDAHNLLASRIAARCNKVQIIWANWMKKQFERCTYPQKWLFFLLLILLLGGYSTYSVFSGLRGATRTAVLVSPVVTPPAKLSDLDTLTPRSAILRAREFKQYLFNLSQTDSGRKIYSRILASHPGLLDSIEKFQQKHKHALR